MSVYWRDNLRWGFDSVVDTQPIWNTAHGRILEVSVYTWTHTRLGQDFTLIEIPLAPVYWLLGGNIAVILVQTGTIALGGIGVYLLARYLLPMIRPSICVLFSALYLSLLFIHSTNLSQFRSRNTIMWTFFFAWLAYRSGRARLLWAMFALALLTRSDVSLVIAMFGVYALIERRKWTISWLPVLVGAGWFFLAVYVVVPHFSTTGYIYEDHYTWLGENHGDIAAQQPIHRREGDLDEREILAEAGVSPCVDGYFQNASVCGVPDGLRIDDAVEPPSQVVAPIDAHAGEQEYVSTDHDADKRGREAIACIEQDGHALPRR